MEKEHLYVENSLTRALDKSLNTAREQQNMPVFSAKGLPGSGATSIIMSWLQHNKLPFIRIDAGCLRLSKEEVEIEDWNSLLTGSDGVTIVGKITEPKKVKRNYEFVFSDKEIDLMNDEKTVVFIDDYDFAPLEVRKHIMILLKKLVVRDIRAVENNYQTDIKCLMFIVRAHSPYVNGGDPYTEDEIRMLGVENL